jgi:hypothetical protein
VPEGAARLRLRAALQEVIAENTGDHPRARARGKDAELIKQAQGLLAAMRVENDGAPADSPGRRAAAGSPGRALDSAKERARELLAPAGANRADAGDGDR